jgi:pimeloyl-ACP methyl ester carboxylesterase
MRASFCKLENVKIGDFNQSLLIRGKNADKPVILYIHGGPGASEMFFYPYQENLENEFVVVNWEQRGAGKSFREDIDLASLNMRQLMSDAYDVSEYIRKKFKQPKIFIMGHSWGSYLGLHLVKAHPELFYCYIGVGQVVNMQKNDKMSYENLLAMARSNQDHCAVRSLLKIGTPPYTNKRRAWIRDKWLDKYGGQLYNPSLRFKLQVLLKIIFGGVYSLADYIRYFKGISLSARSSLHETLYRVDLFQEITEVEIPVLLMMGRHDLLTHMQLANDYFDFLKAPDKAFMIFEFSAHHPMIEETEKFCDLTIQLLSEYL